MSSSVQTTEEKLNLNSNWVAFRKIYSDLLKDRKITVIFRPEKRLCGDFRGYCEGQIVNIGVIEKVGADWGKLPPQFLDESFGKIKVESIEAKPIGDLKKEDFIGSSPDVLDVVSLKYHLGLIYNLAPHQLTDESVVTVIKFSYVQE
ncbi:MAG: hypothetical protein AAB523_03520 [Patescibacteria group bacterium]